MKSMQRMTPVSWRAFAVTAVVAAVLALGAGAPAAFADSASISVTNTAGQSDPAAYVPRVFTISGDASVPEELFVKYRAPGGAPCAPSAESDTGSKLSEGQHEGEWDFAYGNEVNGAFSFQQVYSWGPPGTFVFCIWLAPHQPSEWAAGIITKPIEQSISFRAPTGTITGNVSPATPRPGERATVTVSGSSESPEEVFAKIRKAGGAQCATTYAADTGEDLIAGEKVNGSFSLQATTTQAAGTYVICLWLAGSESDTSPVAGPQTIAFTVGSPPSPTPRSRHNKPHKRAAPQHHARRHRARRPRHRRRARKHGVHKHNDRHRR